MSFLSRHSLPSLILLLFSLPIFADSFNDRFNGEAPSASFDDRFKGDSHTVPPANVDPPSASTFDQRFQGDRDLPPALFCAKCLQSSGNFSNTCSARCGTNSTTNQVLADPDAEPARGHRSAQTPGARPAPGASDKKSSSGTGVNRTASGTPTKAQSSGDPNRDLQICQKALSDARNCCNNPSSCGGNMDTIGSTFQTPNPQQNKNGINNACAQTNQANGAAGNSNTDAGYACYQKYSSCITQCNDLASQNSGDDASSLRSVASSCQDLSSLANMLGSQGLNNYSAQNAGQNCTPSTSAMNPQSLGGMGGANGSDPNFNTASATNNPADPYGCQQNPGSAVCQNCALSPDSPSCKALQEGQETATGKVNFQTASKTNDDFNVGDMNTNAQAAIAAANSQNNMGQAPQGHTIPNGGAPFGGGGDSKPAALDQPSRGGSPGAPGFNPTDIERGMLAGGFSGQPGGGDLSTGSGRGYNYGRGAGGGRGLASAGMDLKKYLPGHRLDPMNRVGGNSLLSAEINPMSVDMFKKISERYALKCRLGTLFDCRGK